MQECIWTLWTPIFAENVFSVENGYKPWNTKVNLTALVSFVKRGDQPIKKVFLLETDERCKLKTRPQFYSHLEAGVTGRDEAL